MPMLVSAGSISTQATSPAASSAASESRSLNSATRVVRSVLAKGHERLVDGAVVAVVEDQHRRRGRVARHRPGVAEGEVDVAVPVDVDHRRAPRLGEVDGEPAGRLVHPGHRDVAEEAAGGPQVGVAASRVPLHERGTLTLQQRAEPPTVDHGAVRAGSRAAASRPGMPALPTPAVMTPPRAARQACATSPLTTSIAASASRIRSTELA